MEWREDTTLFSASLRQSGGSLILTIPKPIVRRFMLKPGQRVAVAGMRRECSVFQGMIGVYLGTFKVVEPASGFELLIENPPTFFPSADELTKAQPLSELASRHHCRFKLHVEEGLLRVKGFFSSLESPSLEPLSEEEVERVAKEIASKLSTAGFKVVGVKTLRIEVEHSVDPVLLAKTKLKDIDGVKYEWIL